MTIQSDLFRNEKAKYQVVEP